MTAITESHGFRGKTTTFTFDDANQLVSSTTDGVTTRYAYDAAGRLVKEGGRTYRYGYLDKVLSVTDGKGKYTYDYHVDGQLATANYGDGKTERFDWDGLALVKRGDEQYINEPHVGGGNPVVSSKGTTYFNDMLGTTVGAKTKGKKYSAAALTAFGERLDNADGPSPAIRSIGEGWFTGKPLVEGLGHAFLFRNYRAGLAKWQTADPLGYPDGWNVLTYARNGASECIDLAGGWCEQVHHDINETYLTREGISLHAYQWGGFSLNVLGGLNSGSDWTDSFSAGNQEDSKAYYHAMRSSGQTVGEAERAWNSYRDELERTAKGCSDVARRLYREGSYDAALAFENEAIEQLGRLLHTFDDSFAPPHSGFQHFSWWGAIGHMERETMFVYETGVYRETTYLGPGLPPLVTETIFRTGGFRDYIYGQILETYAQTIRYVLRQPE